MKRRHGTLARYKAGCRCKPCREVNAAWVREWRAARATPALPRARGIVCVCGGLLLRCDGRLSDFMHSATRSEFCPDGRVALPVEKAWRGAGV